MDKLNEKPWALLFTSVTVRRVLTCGSQLVWFSEAAQLPYDISSDQPSSELARGTEESQAPLQLLPWLSAPFGLLNFSPTRLSHTLIFSPLYTLVLRAPWNLHRLLPSWQNSRWRRGPVWTGRKLPGPRNPAFRFRLQASKIRHCWPTKWVWGEQVVSRSPWRNHCQGRVGEGQLSFHFVFRVLIDWLIDYNIFDT